MDLLSHWLVPVVIFAGLLVLPYLLGPLMIHRTLRQSAEPQLDSFEANDPALPVEVADHFQNVIEALKPLGFEVVRGLALPNQTPRVKALVLLLVNRANKDAALATVMYAQTQEGTRLQTAYVELVSVFRDGTVVLTNNTGTLTAFARRPTHTSTYFPMVRRPDRLYRLHQALVERHGSAAGKKLRLDEEFRGDAVAYLTQSMKEELAAQIPTGYLYLSQEEEVYRPTWKGAFFMTWGLLWPIKNIRRQRRDHKARRLLAELER